MLGQKNVMLSVGKSRPSQKNVMLSLPKHLYLDTIPFD